MEKLRIVMLDPVPVIYANEIASAEIVDGAVHILFAREETLDQERVLIAVLTLIRPLASCLQLTLRDMINAQLAGNEAALQPMN